jgi:hypothetical protein
MHFEYTPDGFFCDIVLHIDSALEWMQVNAGQASSCHDAQGRQFTLKFLP